LHTSDQERIIKIKVQFELLDVKGSKNKKFEFSRVRIEYLWIVEVDFAALWLRLDWKWLQTSHWG